MDIGNETDLSFFSHAIVGPGLGVQEEKVAGSRGKNFATQFTGASKL